MLARTVVRIPVPSAVTASALLVAAGTVVACGGSDARMLLGSPAKEVAASAETKPFSAGADADDPAIWRHPDDAGKSTIIGTDKQGGLAVYDLDGNQIQYLADGDLNNVDLRTGFRLAGESVTLVTAADSTTHRLAIYRVDPATRKLADVAARKITVGIAAYGSCMYRSQVSDKFYAFVNSEDEEGRPGGEVEQWELFERGGKVDGRRVRSFAVGSQTEGCAADDELGELYVGEEDEGIWRYGAEPDAAMERARVDSTGPGGHLVAEVEGLALAATGERSGYLVASSQGDSSFVVYRREPPNEYVKTFRIEAADGIDAVEETDGIDVSTEDLAGDFSDGLLVVQDGKDDSGGTNFKLVPLAR